MSLYVPIFSYIPAIFAFKCYFFNFYLFCLISLLLFHFSFLPFPNIDKKEKVANAILCDFSCLAELSRSCEITLPLKENNTNYLGNLRIHPCAKIENQNMLNNATRIIFIPPHDEFKMGVFEVENFAQDKLPIIGEFKLKESAQNEIKLYLKVHLDQTIISKFEYFFINIPLGHFGEIIKTNIMVQVGEVSLKNKNTTLHWDLQNKIMDRKIELSGTVIYSRKKTHSTDDKKDLDKVTLLTLTLIPYT